MSGRWPALRYRRSLASRVILLTTVAVGLSVTVVAFAAWATVRAQTMGTLDQSLRTRAFAAARAETLDALTKESIPSWALGAADVKIIFVDALTDPPLARSADTRASIGLGKPEIAVARGSQESSARTIWSHGEPWRVVAVHADRGQALVLAQSLLATKRTLDRLGLVMLLFGVAGMISAALAGWTVARSGLRPVRRLTAAVEDIARTQRLDPIPIEGNDEVARLAFSFNAMLRALSESQRRQRQLVADASHELRTPLTSLRTNIDLLAQAGDALDPESRSELLADVRAQMEEMTTLIGDLIELARDEPIEPTVAPVDFAAIINHAVERVRLRGDARFEVTTSPWWVVGDGAALERAVTNLLDNAVKWSPPGATVRVGLTHGSLLVEDDGPGISDEDLPHVFERFYRSAESRAMPGSGLGLSIVQAVALRHGGQVTAGRATGGGAAIRLSLPGQPQSPEVTATT